ncbi:hypothetical protein DV515_00016550 [Chloebia gouldiae]|uniref:Uncharacterized protein n=1 Tax=Chloebia gouldiae TaxID=44316 RepID=A0A3L8RRV5_CHLGU|nr:hypothetical protein DV515_00016550 [Chloebia gouldiae]
MDSKAQVGDALSPFWAGGLSRVRAPWVPKGSKHCDAPRLALGDLFTPVLAPSPKCWNPSPKFWVAEQSPSKGKILRDSPGMGH